MAIIRQNSFESGWANGTAITNGSSGNSGAAAGDYFNAVFASAGNSIQFHATSAHGLQSARLLTAGGGSATIGYDDSSATQNVVHMRGYYRLAGFHTGNIFLMQARGAEGGGTGFSVRLTSAGVLQAYQQSGGVVLGQGTKPLVVNTWYRIEAKFSRTGDWALRAYVLDNTAPYFPELSGTGATSGMGAGFTFLRFGIEGTALNITAYLDDVAYGSTWCGPVPSTYVAPLGVVSGSWVIGDSGGSLVDALGDSSDATYAESPTLTGSYQDMRVYLGQLATGDVSVKVRMSGDNSPTARVRLYQGASTLIASWTVPGIPSTPADFEFALTNLQAASITNRNDLQITVGAIA